MALLFHLLVAFSSLAFTAYMFLRPSTAKMQISTGLILGTLVSGTLLVAANPGHLTQSCVMGLAYLTVTIVGTVAAQRRLAAQKVRSR